MAHCFKVQYGKITVWLQNCYGKSLQRFSNKKKLLQKATYVGFSLIVEQKYQNVNVIYYLHNSGITFWVSSYKTVRGNSILTRFVDVPRAEL